MKKLILTFLVLMILCGAVDVLATSATLTISVDPEADSFTTGTAFAGRFNLSIKGTSFVGTVHLQRSHDAGSTWVDVASWTSTDIETTVDDPERLKYRIGIKNGNYTSGTVSLRLSNSTLTN